MIFSYLLSDVTLHVRHVRHLRNNLSFTIFAFYVDIGMSRMGRLVKHPEVRAAHLGPPDGDHGPQVPLEVTVVGGAEHRDHLVIVTPDDIISDGSLVMISVFPDLVYPVMTHS